MRYSKMKSTFVRIIIPIVLTAALPAASTEHSNIDSIMAQLREGLSTHGVLLGLMEVFGATDIFMVLGKLNLEVELFRQLVAVTLQNRLDLLQT